MTILDSSLHLCIGYRCILKSWCRMGLTVVKPPTAEFVSTEWYLIRGHEDHRGSMHLRPVQKTVMSGESWLRRGMTCYWQVPGYLFCGIVAFTGHRVCNFTQTNIEDVPKHVGPNLVFADDDQQRSRPRPDAFASRLFDPSGCDRQTDRRIKGVLGLLYSARRLNSTKSSENFFFHCRRKPIFSEFFYLYTCMET